ncbi:MAG: hypothetical protein RL654_1883 [Pseudomonadota bacterium]
MNGSDAVLRSRLQTLLIVLAVLLSGGIALPLTGAQPSKLFDADGLKNAADILSGLARPDFSAEFLARVLELSLESLLIGVLGTVMATALGTLLALVAIRVPDLDDPPQRRPAWQRGLTALLRQGARLLLNFCRSVPEIVWAYLFVQLLGLGPGAAVLAIMLTVGGNIGKLYAELAEALEPGAIRALRATGASRGAVLLHAVLPQVRRAWTGYALFCLECNIRIGSILGVVGAGGLGSEIALSLRYYQYDKLATTLLAVLVFVVALEALGARLRRGPLPRTLALAGLGTAAALWRLEIPWADLWSGSSSVALLSFDHLAPDAVFVRTVARQTGETVLMAWAATLASALGAAVLAPLAAVHLSTGSFLPDPPRPAWPRRLARWLGRQSARAVLQLTRVMPELTLALVFVVWVGGGPLAGILAIAVHNLGVMGRLFADVLDEAEPGPPAVLQAQGAGRLAVFVAGVWPQVRARLAAFALYRFEVNVRATTMVGFVGAGGIGDALHTAISLFHVRDLTLLLIVLLSLVALVDLVGDRLRARLLATPDRGARCAPPALTPSSSSGAFPA